MKAQNAVKSSSQGCGGTTHRYHIIITQHSQMWQHLKQVHVAVLQHGISTAQPQATIGVDRDHHGPDVGLGEGGDEKRGRMVQVSALYSARFSLKRLIYCI